MLCVTMNDIPGWEIQRVCGEVFGITVRSRNAFSQMGAGFKSLVGGELQGMTRNVLASRNEAMNRMFAEAQARGGNALIDAVRHNGIRRQLERDLRLRDRRGRRAGHRCRQADRPAVGLRPARRPRC